MICNTTIGNGGTTLSSTMTSAAGSEVRHDLGLARVRRVDDWAAPFGANVPMIAAVAVVKQPQTYVPQPPHERSP